MDKIPWWWLPSKRLGASSTDKRLRGRILLPASLWFDYEGVHFYAGYMPQSDNPARDPFAEEY
jgi:hypothetical protein